MKQFLNYHILGPYWELVQAEVLSAFFSSTYCTVEIALNFEKFCSLNTEKKVNILDIIYEVIKKSKKCLVHCLVI